MSAIVSTLPSAKSALLALLAAQLPGVQTAYAWPGPNTSDQSVFLGRHPDIPGNILGFTTQISSPIANITTGRKRRNEDYPIEVTLWSWRPDMNGDPANAAATDLGAFALLAGLENVLADNAQLGLATVEYVELESVDLVGGGPVPFQSGWASILIASVRVKARLT